MKFKLDAERITLNQLIEAQAGDLRATRDILAANLVDEDGEYVEEKEAQRQVGALKLTQVKGTIQEFLKQLREDAVNPQPGGN